MPRRGGLAVSVKWIVALTLVMAAATAWLKAGSTVAGWTLLVAGLVFAPPVQAVIAELFHPLLPTRLAFYAATALVPLGALFVVIDGIAKLEKEATALGFASSGQMARARDLGLSNPRQLADHDAAQAKAAHESRCRALTGSRPLECLEPDHRKAALAFAGAFLAPGDYEQAVRDAIAEQRKAFLAVDKACTAYLDRLEQDALPTLLTRRDTGVAIAARIWAERFSAAELEVLAKPAQSGVSFMRTSDIEAVEKKVAGVSSQIDEALDRELQAWARSLVDASSGWSQFISGKPPIAPCQPAEAKAVR